MKPASDPAVEIALPADADGMLALAAQHVRQLRALGDGHDGRRPVAPGDLDQRGYKRFLPALGRAEHEFVGRRVEEVVPNSLMAQVVDSGRAILVDLLTNQAGTFVVSRLPLRDAQGEVIGALGLVLLDHPVDDAAAAGQVQPPAGRARRGALADRRAAPAQVHDRELRRRERAGDGGQAQGAARRRPTRRCCSRARPGPARSCSRTASTRRARARHGRSSRSTSRRCRTRCSRPSSSASRPAPTPAPTARDATASSSWPTVAPLFLDEIGDMPLRCRPSCCACCRSTRSFRWAAARAARRRAHRRRDEPRPAGDGRRRHLPRRPVLSPNVLPIRLPPARAPRRSEALAEGSPTTSRAAAAWRPRALSADARPSGGPVLAGNVRDSATRSSRPR